MNQEILDEYFPGLVVPKSQEDDFERKLRLKGLIRYSNLYRAVKEHTKDQITYQSLSEYYRYDIKLRRALHKIIAFTEVAMRATVNNLYPNAPLTFSKWKTEISGLFGKEYKPGKIIIGKINCFFDQGKKEESTLFDLLENSDLQVLNSMFLLLDSNQQSSLFKSDFDYLKENLDALRELRNCVEHHQLLIIKDLKEVWFSGKKKTGLKANIENAINLSPELAKEKLKSTINDCLIINESEERSEQNTYHLLPEFKVYFDDIAEHE